MDLESLVSYAPGNPNKIDASLGLTSPSEGTGKKGEGEGASMNNSKSKAKKEAKKAEKAEKAAQRQQHAIAAAAAAQGSESNEEDPLSSNYGDLLEEVDIQSKSITGRIWTDVGKLCAKMKGKSVWISGAAQVIRPVSKKMAFLVVRRRMSTVQCVLIVAKDLVSPQMVCFAASLSKESIVSVEGIISVPNEPIKGTTQQVEIQVRKLYCITRSSFFGSFSPNQQRPPATTRGPYKKENSDEASKLRRVRATAKTTGPSANLRGRSLLSLINAGALPDNMSDAERRLAEKLDNKKNDIKEENLYEASKLRRVGATAKTTGPSANLRGRSVLSTINAGALPDYMSDMERRLAEKLKIKKNDIKKENLDEASKLWRVGARAKTTGPSAILRGRSVLSMPNAGALSDYMSDAERRLAEKLNIKKNDIKKEKLDEASKLRIVRATAKTTGPSANMRGLSVLSMINAGALPNSMSDAERRIAEKLKIKKNGIKGKCEQQNECTDKSRLCKTEQANGHLAEEDESLTSTNSEAEQQKDSKLESASNEKISVLTASLEEMTREHSHTIERESMRDWADLPPDMIHLISNKLADVTDFIRFRAVCKSWGSSAPLVDPPPQLPWLLEGISEDSPVTNLERKLRFYSLSTHETYTIPKYKPYFGVQYHGPCSGYFIDPLTNSGQLRMWNPLTNALLSFPSVPQFSFFLWPVWTGSDPILSRNIIFVGRDRENLDKTECWAYHPGNTRWNVVKGCFYDSCCYWNDMFFTTSGACNTKVFDGTLQKLLFEIPPPEDTHVSRWLRSYLVEISGVIMRVCRYLNWDQNVEESLFCFYELKFEGKNEKPSWVEVSDIGNHMVFLDWSNGFSMKPIAGFKGNCIYFLSCGGNTPCRYDIATNTFQRVPSPFKTCSWFFPSLC